MALTLGDVCSIMITGRGSIMVEQQYPEPTVGALIFSPEDRLLLVRSHKWRNKTVRIGQLRTTAWESWRFIIWLSRLETQKWSSPLLAI